MARLARALALYAAATVAIAFLNDRSLALSGVLIIVLAVTLLVDRQPHDIWFPIGGFVFGPLTEMISIGQGGWEYAAPDFAGIPLWLPFGWATAGLLLRRLADALGALTTGSQTPNS
jgi:hypothetical protein